MALNGGMRGNMINPTTFRSANGRWNSREQFARKNIDFWPETPDPHWASVTTLLRMDMGEDQNDYLTQRVKDYGSDDGDVAWSPEAIANTNWMDNTINVPTPWTTTNSYYQRSTSGTKLQTIRGAGFAGTAFGTGDFTIECWVWHDILSPMIIFDLRTDGSDGSRLLIGSWTGGGAFYWVGSLRIPNAGTSFVGSTWQHFALCRASGTTRLFVDGTQVGSNYADSHNFPTASTKTYGGSVNDADNFDGSLGPLRITTGVARYTSNFTRPAIQFPAH